MNDRKERVYSEEDLCEYTILQKIDELEKQVQNINNVDSNLYETKEDANNSHSTLSNNIASVNSNLQLHIEENVRKFSDIDNTFNHIDKFTPTDVGIKNNKLGLMNGSTWLTNRNAINLEGFTYDEATNTLKSSGGDGGISVIELTNNSGTIPSEQLSEINAKPQNFAFKYSGKILSFTSSDSTSYQYCNNITNSSDNNVMTTSILLTITSSTGAYTIVENVHNVVANSIHQANGGDLTNIQVGSKVYSIPSGGGGVSVVYKGASESISIPAKEYQVGETVFAINTQLINALGCWVRISSGYSTFNVIDINGVKFIPVLSATFANDNQIRVDLVCIKGGTTTQEQYYTIKLIYSTIS